MHRVRHTQLRWKHAELSLTGLASASSGSTRFSSSTHVFGSQQASCLFWDSCSVRLDTNRHCEDHQHSVGIVLDYSGCGRDQHVKLACRIRDKLFCGHHFDAHDFVLIIWRTRRYGLDLCGVVRHALSFQPQLGTFLRRGSNILSER